VETKLCFRKNHSSSCECIVKTYQIKRLQRQLCICVDANITKSVKKTYIFLSLVYGFRCTQAGTKPPMKPRNNVKSELVKDLKRKGQCAGLDCQKWTVRAWSKVRLHQLLRYKLKKDVFQFVYERSTQLWVYRGVVVSTFDFRSVCWWFEACFLPSCRFLRQETILHILSPPRWKMSSGYTLFGGKMDWTSIASRGE